MARSGEACTVKARPGKATTAVDVGDVASGSKKAAQATNEMNAVHDKTCPAASRWCNHNAGGVSVSQGVEGSVARVQDRRSKFSNAAWYLVHIMMAARVRYGTASVVRNLCLFIHRVLQCNRLFNTVSAVTSATWQQQLIVGN